LTVYSVTGRERRGRLYLRVLDVSAVMRGQVQTRSCGSLAATDVPSGGFVEFDSQNQCIWAYNTQTLRCWDALTFEERFKLGPWGAEDVQNVRFTLGGVGLLKCLRTTLIEVCFHCAKNGKLLSRCEVPVDEGVGPELTFLELINQQLLLKRQGSEVVMVDLVNGKQRVLPGTSKWEPELFVFLPSQGLMLARLGEALEIWRCGRAGGCCRIGVVRPVMDFSAHRFSIDERLAVALVVRPPMVSPRMVTPRRRTIRGVASPMGSMPFQSPVNVGTPASVAASPRLPCPGRMRHREAAQQGESIALLDLLGSGEEQISLQAACHSGTGNIAHLSFDMASGSLLTVGRSGGVFMMSSPDGA